MSQAAPMVRGLVRHFLLTLQLNFRSRQALIYGYLVPVFFLLAFGSVFRDDTPLLFHQMGQLLVITILGGACFGLPTALVAERERGVWRRYRLLPVGTARLVLGTLAARLVIIALAVVMQIALARVIYGTPFPLHPLQTGLAVLFVTGSLLGLGLLVAALADDVPAVQALGQCLFLPMIMIGGVGVPLEVLPVWAQRLAGFMPGRYAVDLLDRGVTAPDGLTGAGFSLLALGVIGVAAGAAGARLFRWDAHRHLGGSARIAVGVAFGAWIAVGAGAACTGHLKPVLPEAALWQSITEAEIASITYQDLPGDHEFVTPLAAPFHGPTGDRNLAALADRLRRWPPGRLDNAGQSIRNLVCVAAIADLTHDPREAEVARLVLDQLQARFDHDDLRHALAWIVAFPDDGKVVNNAPELGFSRHPPEVSVRSRSALYARKYLGRVLGKIPD